MNNFLAMLDKLVQRPAANCARVRVFKLEANPDSPENSPAPERLPAASSQPPQPGRPVGRKRRPQS
ncbi:MAG: hypothetical protein J0I12_33595 [Candidatus Eremiobacteraeota bacterium]|nr:hypothetical protein [Candidatus Eremiobacteraeota bacterium]